MEKPSWAPVVFTGIIPRGLADLLAITIIAIVSLEATIVHASFGSRQLGLGILLFAVPLTCALASLSDTTRKLKEELALLAYGGSSWHLSLRYFFRGVACTLIGISPFIYLEYSTSNYSAQPTILLALVSVAGGIFYSAPSLRRIRSSDFAENYKG